MNVPKAIEQAMATLIRNNVELGPGVTIRTWQTLRYDNSWVENKDRVFPMLDIRCATPTMGDNQVALSCECAILMGTNADDDEDHSFVSHMYDSIQVLMDNMYVDYRAGNRDNEPLKTYIDTIQTAVGASKFRFGGIQFGEGTEPYEDAGINMIGISVVTHYGRDDF